MRLRHWITAMRLPFTSVAVVPFAVGGYLAHAHGQLDSPLALLMGLVAVFLLCIGCYLLGEVYDQKEDQKTTRTPFSGGTLLVANGTLPARVVTLAAVAVFVIALGFGAAILVIRQSLLLAGLGLFGVFAAVFYSTPPIRLVKRGFGEVLIGVCYGWLTLVTGYATASGALPPFSLLISMPIALTVFNIILINEFPDYEADRTTAKRNLLVRIGREHGAQVYAATSFLASLGLLACWFLFRQASLGYLALTLPAVLLGLGLAVAVLFGRRWQDLRKWKPVAGLTIVLNLLSTVTLGTLVRWS